MPTPETEILKSDGAMSHRNLVSCKTISWGTILQTSPTKMKFIGLRLPPSQASTPENNPFNSC